MGTLGKVALWVLAILGGAVVVKKFAPKLYDKAKDKFLSAKSKAKELVTGQTILVSCVPTSNPAGGNRKPNSGVQSSPFHRWCYLVREGDSAGKISERVFGDDSRYAELLVANPDVPTKGKMGIVIGDEAWDFASGSLNEGTKIFIPQTWNGWIDQFGVAKGTYVPYPPDSRMIVETSGEEVETSGESKDEPLLTSDTSGFDYEGA